MDAAAAQQSLRRHLRYLQEMGFLYLEPGARRGLECTKEPSADPAPKRFEGDSAPVGSIAMPEEAPPLTDVPTESRARAGAEGFSSAEPALEALEWPATLFSRPSRPPLEVVNPPLRSRGPGETGSGGMPWDPDELLAIPASKGAREKPKAEELDLFAEASADSGAECAASASVAPGTEKADTTGAFPAAAAEKVSESDSTEAGDPSEAQYGAAPVVTLTCEERVEKLSAIAREVAACRTCSLHESRTHVVPGQGNPTARVVFVGEGPGQTEDDQGLAFVGRAGQLLTEIIRAMQLTRDDVFICNVVKCRPPGNRVPAPDEMAACEPFLKRQLEILRPEVIVALGGVAVKCLLRDPKLSITRIRGTWQRYEGIPLMPTFHPAYLLRNPWDKPKVWEDIQKVMRVFGLEPKARA